MAPEYKDPTLPSDEVRVDSWSAAVGRERHWYNPLTWENSSHIVEKRSFNRFADDEVPTQAKRRKVEAPTGVTREASKDGTCWTEEQVDIFVYVTPHYIKKRWIEYWQIDETLEGYYAVVRDIGQNAEDLASTAKSVAQSAGLKASTPGAAPPSTGGLIGTATAGAAAVLPAVAAEAGVVTEGLVVGVGMGAGALTETAAVGGSLVYAGATAAGAVGSAAVTLTGQVLVPAIAIVGTAVASFVATTRIVESKLSSSNKVSEGWELVGPFDGPEAFESSVGTWRQVGPTRDCPGTADQHWTTPQPEHWTTPQPEPRTGFEWQRWWWLGALALLALAALAAAVFIGPRGGGSSSVVPATAAVSAAGLPSLKARLVAPSTVFTVEYPNSVPAGLTYRWIGAIGCGTFAPFSKAPSAPVSGGSEAIWTHPNAPLPPPDLSRSDLDGNGVPDYCPHSEVPNFSHPGTITVLMTDGKGADSYCTYEGSLDGTGQCHLGKP